MELNRRRLGKTNLMVTELSFGAMNFRGQEKTDQAHQLLDFVLAQGVNLIDTARAYNGKNQAGEYVESEVLVGQALQRNRLSEPIVIISKHHGYEIPEFTRDLETTRAKLEMNGQGSIRIGDNDIRFVYLFHGINEERWATMLRSGVLDQAAELKRQGVLNYIGFSSHYPHKDVIRQALETDRFDVVELPYNVFNRSMGEDGETDLLKLAYDREVGVINMKAFCGNGMVPVMHLLEEVTNIDYAGMLNFCLGNPCISTVDAGAKLVDEFRLDMTTALGERLSARQRDELKKAADKVSPHMQNICRECMHCLEKFGCPRGLDFPSILGLYSRYLLASRLGRNTDQFREQYRQFSLTADDCIECGECLPWCEYDLDIPNMLKQADKALG